MQRKYVTPNSSGLINSGFIYVLAQKSIDKNMRTETDIVQLLRRQIFLSDSIFSGFFIHSIQIIVRDRKQILDGKQFIIKYHDYSLLLCFIIILESVLHLLRFKYENC